MTHLETRLGSERLEELAGFVRVDVYRCLSGWVSSRESGFRICWRHCLLLTGAVSMVSP